MPNAVKSSDCLVSMSTSQWTVHSHTLTHHTHTGHVGITFLSFVEKPSSFFPRRCMTAGFYCTGQLLQYVTTSLACLCLSSRSQVD